MEQAVIPETAEGALRSIEERGHPWRGTTLTRTDWAEGLDIKILAEDSEVDILFWVGCTEALEERSMKVAQAVAKILKLAGINFGILGADESCCGEPARRLGNEYLFQLQAQKNIELLKNYNVERIVTGCPHCYNTIKNEYPQFGGEFEVVHHAEFIAQLLEEGGLKLGQGLNQRITFQDPCYLGRHNGIYDEPRQVLESIPGLELVEMYDSRENSLCCGGGGGRIWEETKKGERFSDIRIEQALEAGASILATACPDCMVNFEDSVLTLDKGDVIEVKGIAELIQQAI